VCCYFGITIAAPGVGIAHAALDAAPKHSHEREQFDEPIGDFQAIQHKLADRDTKIQAARLLMHQAAEKKIRGEQFIKEAAQAKLYASELSREVAKAASRSTAARLHDGLP
jgi:alkylation response protein AidB-like acyl-CoA dehydrogenase